MHSMLFHPPGSSLHTGIAGAFRKFWVSGSGKSKTEVDLRKAGMCEEGAVFGQGLSNAETAPQVPFLRVNLWLLLWDPESNLWFP